MPRLRLATTGGIVGADGPRPDMRRGRHLQPGRAWRSTARWQKLRALVLAEEPACALCGSTEDLTVDHIIPVAAGGARFDRANCRTACRRCNSSRGARR